VDRNLFNEKVKEAQKDLASKNAMDKISLKSSDIKANLKFKYLLYKIKRSMKAKKFLIF